MSIGSFYLKWRFYNFGDYPKTETKCYTSRVANDYLLMQVSLNFVLKKKKTVTFQYIKDLKASIKKITCESEFKSSVFFVTTRLQLSKNCSLQLIFDNKAQYKTSFYFDV